MKGSLFLLCTVLVSLSACSSFQFSDQSAAQNPTVTGRTLARKIRDHTTEAKISSALRKQAPSLMKGSNIDVICANGVVLLLGNVANNTMRTLATKTAKNQEGVRDVYNELSLRSANSSKADKTRWTDRWINTKLRSAYLFNESLSADEIVIRSVDGRVYLMGLVTPEQAANAIAIARKTKGVARVFDVFEHAY